MYTNNLAIELMAMNQINKEVLFNEAMLKIDSILAKTILDIVQILPDNAQAGDSYILISKNADKGDSFKLAFFLNNQWYFVACYNGLIAYVEAKNSFFIFKNNKLLALSNLSTSTEARHKKFIEIKGLITIKTPSSIFYFSLVGNTKITIETLEISEITLIFKQSNSGNCEVSWGDNILWPDNKVHVINKAPGAIEIIKLFLVADEKKFLATIIGTNYSS